jgi:hypothetical protein
MHPTVKAARVAGAIYLSLVLVGPFTLMYVPDKLIVRGDAAATAGNILAHEMLFRSGIVADLLGTVMFICLGIALYRLLRGVNQTQAWLMVAFVLVSAAIAFVNAFNNLAALILFRGADFLTAFDPAQRNALGMLFIRLHGQGTSVNEIFWGLWLWPFGILVYQSGFLPRILGAWLIVNCFAWLGLSLTALLVPQYESAFYRFASPVFFGEIAIMLWLLIRGANAKRVPVPAT